MISDEETLNDIPSGVSMESAAYMENTINDVQENIIILHYQRKLLKNTPQNFFLKNKVFKKIQ